MSDYRYTVETQYAFTRQIARQISSHAPESAIEALLQAAQQYFEAAQSALWSVNTSTHQTVLLHAAPRSIHDDHFPIDKVHESIAIAAETREPSLIALGDYSAWFYPFALKSCPHVYVISLLTRTPLPDDIRDLLLTWSSLLGICIERLQAQAYAQQAQKHYEQRLREVTALYEIGRAMEGNDLQVLLDLITRKAAEVMEAQVCSLMLLDEDERMLVIRSSYGLPGEVVEQARVPWGKGIAGRVAANGEPMLIIDPRTDPRLAGEDVPYREDIAASLCVPLRDGHGQVMGVLNIHRRKPAYVFTEQDMRLFSVFAMQAASAIKNARLYSDLKHRVNELSVISELSAAVNSTLELEKILQQTADGIVETVRFDRCAIFLLDESGKLAIPRALRGYHPKTLGDKPVHVADGVIGIAVRGKELLLVENAQQSSQPARGFGRMLGTNAFLVAPILARNRVIGVVVADNKPTGRPIERANIQLLTTFINQAGMAIENARLYHDLDRRYGELHNLWEYTRNLLSSIGVGVVSIDRDEIVLTWNNAAERITDVPHEKALGYKLQELVARFLLPSEEEKQLLEIVRHPFRTGERYSRFKCVLHPARSGEVYFNFESSPLRAPDGSVQGVVFVFEDVTHEVQMEKEIQRVAQLAAVGQLAATVAHELRNPLSSIRVSAQHLRSEYTDDPTLCEFLDIIISEVDKLNTKTREFLRFARPVEPVFQEVNLHDLIHGRADFMKPYLIEQNVHMEIDVADSLTIRADPNLLADALSNLIINAVQAMPQGGNLYLSASAVSSDTVCIVVKDTGEGISAEDLERVFTPFYTTKASGTGLGLSIVQKIVESHGGSIEIRSEVGVGTEVRITLPVHPALRILRVDLGEPENLRTSIPDL
jgi:PAS domain S-box-containing protein